MSKRDEFIARILVRLSFDLPLDVQNTLVRSQVLRFHGNFIVMKSPVRNFIRGLEGRSWVFGNHGAIMFPMIARALSIQGAVATTSNDPDLRSILDAVRPRVGRCLRGAYGTFEMLVGDLIQVTAATPEAISQLARELEDPEMLACVRRWVMSFEFQWFMAAVLVHGDRVLDLPWLAWPAATQRNAWLVRVAAIRIWDAAKGLALAVATTRRRGRPARPDVAAQVDLILRERLYGGRSMREAAFRAAPHLVHPWSPENFYEHVKRAAREEPAPPASWSTSLWAKIVAPLREIDPLRVTSQRKRDVAVLREREREPI